METAPPAPPMGWVRVKVGSRFIFTFYNGRGGWMVYGNCPTHPSFRLGLESRLGAGFNYVLLWVGWDGGFEETRIYLRNFE